MDALINYLLQFGQLNQQQIDLITSKATHAELRKDQYFSEAGKVPDSVGFVVEGVLRICYYNNPADDITRYFVDENHMVVDINCFDNKLPASEYIQAVTNCKLIMLSRVDWEDLSNTIIGWDAIINKIIQKALIEKLSRKAPLIEQDATTRYL
ncbi:MAG: cyclic nucleotide-binding domain-containing protein, partial [Pedobacter sp.]